MGTNQEHLISDRALALHDNRHSGGRVERGSPGLPDRVWDASLSDGRSIEQIYDPVRKAREFRDRWNNWFRLKRLSPCQRYLNGEFGFAIRRVGIDPRQDGLVFWLIPAGQLVGPDNPKCGAAQSESKVAVHYQQAPVLSSDVHLMEGVEEVIPSFVRRETFDSRPVLRGKPLYLSHTRVRELGRALGNREGYVFYVRSAVAFGERDSQNVEAAADAVYDNTSLGVDEKRQGISDLVFDRLLAALRIEISRGFIRACLLPGFDASDQSFKLGYGPINGCPGFEKIISQSEHSTT
jgi:hypothetical protein